VHAGGGHGWGVTKWGAAADNVLRFEVALACGSDGGSKSDDVSGSSGIRGDDYNISDDGLIKLQDVTRESHPQLFAGLKGAGAEQSGVAVYLWMS
jgi:FAD/FMN-containing dehydrogenase